MQMKVNKAEPIKTKLPAVEEHARKERAEREAIKGGAPIGWKKK
jgi:hypothetical protein